MIFFRVLYSKIAVPYCPKCGGEIRNWDSSQIVIELLENYLNERALITFETGEPLASLSSRGFHRLLLNNEVREIDDFEVAVS